jgi:hypothetical protein
MTVLGPRLASRTGTLEIGKHGAVTLSIRNFRCDHEGQIGADISYQGHRDDMVRTGCISADLLDRTPYDQLVESEFGLMAISSKAARNHRGYIDVSYCVDNLALIGPLLPGVVALFPDGIPRLAIDTLSSEEVRGFFDASEGGLNAALELQERYPGVKVTARYFDGEMHPGWDGNPTYKGWCIEYGASDPALLVKYSLAGSKDFSERRRRRDEFGHDRHVSGPFDGSGLYKVSVHIPDSIPLGHWSEKRIHSKCQQRFIARLLRRAFALPRRRSGKST